MPRHVLVTANTDEGEDQDCVLNDGSSQCNWQVHPGRRCRTVNALFNLDMSVYNGTRPDTSRTRAVVQNLIANGKILQINARGVQAFCWRHSRNITGLRITGQDLRGLTTTVPIPRYGVIASFAKVPTTSDDLDAKYGLDNTVPYGLDRYQSGHSAMPFQDSLCHRDFGEYANDARLNVGPTRAATNPNCTHPNAPRHLPCWELTPGEALRVNCLIVAHVAGAGGRLVYVLRATKPIPAYADILTDYGESYWEGIYCPDPASANRWGRKCHNLREVYRGRGRGARGRGRGRGVPGRWRA